MITQKKVSRINIGCLSAEYVGWNTQKIVLTILIYHLNFVEFEDDEYVNIFVLTF